METADKVEKAEENREVETNGKNAYREIIQVLEDGESIEAVCFGAWGWDGYGEPEPPLIPKSAQGVLLAPDIARRYMQGWSFYSGFGAPECYATCIWTNQRVFWVMQYDGSTRLCHMPRNPKAATPEMPGG